jgi:hypothetical protein
MWRERRTWAVTACLALGLAGFATAAAGARGEDTGKGAGAGRPAPAPASVRPAGLDAKALAAWIDRALADAWAAAHVHPAPPADDAEFLRRVYLDLVGKVPTAAEAREFLDDPAPAAEKRARLVESLLDSSAYLSRATETYRALLLPEAETDAQVRGLTPTFDAWLRRRVAENAGYDRIAREVLTVRLGGRGRRAGNALDPRAEPSPLAYYVAKGGKPENLAAGVSRLFLGVRMECAQCHNHPFAKWKREEFWGLAAFFAGVAKAGRDDAVGQIREAPDLREVVIPGTTKVVRAAFPGVGGEPRWRRGASGREILADWVTAPDNPYFARAAVNRVWARFFGIGLVEPVDDMGAENPPAHPEILDRLAREFRDHRYDLKYLIRALTATRAYGLTSAVGRSEQAPPHLFAAMPLRSLSPGQLFDSLAQATGFRDGPGRDAADAPRGRFLELFADRDEKPTEGQTSILQALALMNGPVVAAATSPETGDTLAAVAEAPFLDTAGKVGTLYLAALTRRPRPEEMALMSGYVDRGKTEADRTKALADVFWALLNSPEFRFNH